MGNMYECEDTNDKVFLLSYQDYLDIEYGFDLSIDASETRLCKYTDYALIESPIYTNDYYGNYMTRSPSSNELSGAYGATICYISSSGEVKENNSRVDMTSLTGVRPAINIKI